SQPARWVVVEQRRTGQAAGWVAAEALLRLLTLGRRGQVAPPGCWRTLRAIGRMLVQQPLSCSFAFLSACAAFEPLVASYITRHGGTCCGPANGRRANSKTNERAIHL